MCLSVQIWPNYALIVVKVWHFFTCFRSRNQTIVNDWRETKYMMLQPNFTMLEGRSSWSEPLRLFWSPCWSSGWTFAPPQGSWHNDPWPDVHCTVTSGKNKRAKIKLRLCLIVAASLPISKASSSSISLTSRICRSNLISFGSGSRWNPSLQETGRWAQYSIIHILRGAIQS